MIKKLLDLGADPADTEKAERVVIGFIVATATLCVSLIAVYLFLFDARGVLN